MIHLFTGAKEICNLPGRACTACAKCCDNIDCKPCQDAFDECCTSLCGFMSRPLGLYVVLGVALSSLEIFSCMTAIVQGTAISAEQPQALFKECHFKTHLAQSVGISNWLHLQLGAAWMNLIFAPYIQYRLFQNLQQDAQAGAGGMAQLTKAQVKTAFSDIFWHDIGVCLYVFVLFGSVVWSLMGFTWIQGDADCDPDGYGSYSVQLGVLFFMFVITYFVFWSCYLECMSTLEIRATEYHLPQAAAAMAFAGGAPAMQQQGVLGAVFGGKPQVSAAPPSPTSGLHGVPLVHGVPVVQARQSAVQRALRPGQLCKLLVCLVLDAFGDATYAIPAAGEGVDVVYAPVQAIALRMLFQSNAIALFGFMEEILPFTDIIPSATFAWFLEINGWFDEAQVAVPAGHPGHPTPSAPPRP